MKLTVLWIVMGVLVIIIFYFFIRLRQMMKTMPGARSDMGTKELIINWQEQKAKENEYQEELRKKAKEQAKPEVEKILVNRFKQEEIDKATIGKGTQFKTKLKEGIGIDIDKATSQESMNRMIGARRGPSGETEHVDIFNRDRISSYAAHGDINQSRIKNAAGGDTINWGKSARDGIKSSNTFAGVQRAIYGDKVNTEKVMSENVKRRPPRRP